MQDEYECKYPGGIGQGGGISQGGSRIEDENKSRKALEYRLSQGNTQNVERSL